MTMFKDIVRAALETARTNEAAALASLVRIRGSSPRHSGARMLIWPDGRFIGTIGGGTLEWRVIEHARQALAEGHPRLTNYIFDTHGGPNSVGLCGGSVDVYIDVNLRQFAEVSQAAFQALERGERVALASIVGEGQAVPQREDTYLLVWPDGRTFGSLGGGVVERGVLEEAQAALVERKSRFIKLDPQEIAIHIDVLQPDPVLLIIGAGHIAQPLAMIGGMLGMRVYVVDDREEWANRERFPTAAEIAVIGYEPVHEILDPIPFPMTPATSVVITTWGYDLPAMEQAILQNPAYIGLVASPTKARELFKRMRVKGLPDDLIRKVKAPAGLDVGAESPAEIAVSILGEILNETRGGSALPLHEVRGQRIQALFDQPPVAR
jgi:xanthine dehydrogenase accessory factor